MARSYLLMRALWVCCHSLSTVHTFWIALCVSEYALCVFVFLAVCCARAVLQQVSARLQDTPGTAHAA